MASLRSQWVLLQQGGHGEGLRLHLVETAQEDEDLVHASQGYPHGHQEKSLQCDAIYPSEFHGITESFTLEKVFKIITSKQQPDLRVFFPY